MSETKNEIQVFLEKSFDDKEEQFNEGFGLFVKYSRNRNLQNHIQKRGTRELSRLLYNLKILAKGANIKPSKVIGTKVPAVITKKIVNNVTDTTALPSMAGPGNINPSALTPELKVEFNNGKTYAKKAQFYHMKMKDKSITDEQRAEYRKEMLLHSDKAKPCFKKCSDFIAQQNADGKRVKQEPKVEPLSAKEIGAIRKYVSTKLKTWDKLKGAAKTKSLTALNTRIAKMQVAGEEFAAETVQKLKDIGVYFGE